VSFWGAIGSIGSSVLGGLFGRKKKAESSTTTSYVDYDRLVRDSEAAGFNPLTALRNGGSAGFSVSTTTSPSTPLSSPTLGGSVASGINAFLENFDPHKDDARDVGYGVIRAQLQNLQNDPRRKIGFGDVPSTTGRRVVSSTPVLSSRDKEVKFKGSVPEGVQRMELPETDNLVTTTPGSAVPSLNPLSSQPPELERPKRLNPYPSYLGLEINPWTSSAEAWEDWYGDNAVVSLGATLLNGSHDVAWNSYRIGRWGYRKGKEIYKNPPLSAKRFRKEDYHQQGTNIYGLPAGTIPSGGIVPRPKLK